MFDPLAAALRRYADRAATWLAPHARLNPDAVTVLGVLCALAAALFLRVAPGAAGLLVLAMGGADLLDGALARQLPPHRTGAFTDAVADRVGEVILLAGFAWCAPSRVAVLLVGAALASSLLVSYVATAADGLGFRSARGGPAPRGARLVLLAVAAAVPVLRNGVFVAITVLCIVTLVIRVLNVYQPHGRGGEGAAQQGTGRRGKSSHRWGRWFDRDTVDGAGGADASGNGPDVDEPGEGPAQ